jgi:hypothetical protein
MPTRITVQKNREGEIFGNLETRGMLALPLRRLLAAFSV